MDLRDLDACLERAFALTSSDLQRAAERQRDATEYARFDDIMRGAIVGYPAVEE